MLFHLYTVSQHLSVIRGLDVSSAWFHSASEATIVDQLFAEIDIVVPAFSQVFPASGLFFINSPELRLAVLSLKVQVRW